MSGYIAEFFGYRAEDQSSVAMNASESMMCPFLESICTKKLSRDNIPSGVCAIKQKREGSPSVICCPNRIYADNYKILKLIASRSFKQELNLYRGKDAIQKAMEELWCNSCFWPWMGRRTSLATTKRYRFIFC